MATSAINASGSSDLPYTTNGPQTVSAPSSNSLLGDLGSLGSDLGSLLSGSGSLSSIGSDLSNLAGNPTVQAGTLIGAGEYEAGQAQKQTAGLTSQLTTPAQPFVSGANTELSQTLSGLTGNGAAPPAGSSVAQQETAAKELGDVATQYGTGQLTTAQQAQVQQYIQQQQQEIRSQLANQGVTDSSVLAMYDEQIQNNAAQLTQSLVSQNLGISEQALSSVQSTYNTLLNQSISQFTAGMGPIEDAVNLTVQQNTAISGELNSLFGQIARGLSGASGSSGSGSNGSGSSGSASSLGSLLKGASSLYGDLAGTSLAAYGSGAPADAAVASQLGDVSSLGDVGDQGLSDLMASEGFSSAGGAAAGAAGASLPAGMSAAVGAAPTAAELGTTADAVGGGASGAGMGAAAGAAGALAGAALPLALAALVPYNSGFSIGEINSMEQDVANATQANGGPINAGYVLNPDGTVNQAHAQSLNDLYTLIGDNSDEFTKAGGQDAVVQFLASLGYGPLFAGSAPITSPAPGGRGWLGGGYTGKVLA